MKLNQNWDRAVGIAAACIGLALFLWVFFEVKNPLVYCVIAATGGLLAYKRMKARETPFERMEREARRTRM